MPKRKKSKMSKTDASLLRSISPDDAALEYWETMAAQAIFERIEQEYAARLDNST
jgi:hypothetical protein